MKALLSVLIVATAVMSARPAGRADSSEPFTLGVLRRDGIVIPFAAFDGSQWSLPWPSGLLNVEIPISLDDIPRKWWGKNPAAPEWTHWSNGDGRQTVRLERPQPLRLLCATRIGLRSDYQSSEPVPPPFVQPYPKDGLVVSGPQRVDALEILSRTSRGWAEIEANVRDPFNQAEDRAAVAYTEWRHPFKASARHLLPVELEALYRAPMDASEWVAYFFEAVRRYPPSADDRGCGLITSASGWILVPPKGKTKFDINAHVTYCDRKGALFMLPLGLVKAAGRNYWVYQISGYTREWYVVVRPTPRVVEYQAEYGAGSCPQ